MSADAWDPCPRCARRRKNEALQAEVLAAEAYGKVPSAEWQGMTAAAAKLREPGEDTLRQDYEQGIHPDGHFFVSYCADCTECDYAFSFKHREDFPP